jgi:hypothetical protein
VNNGNAAVGRRWFDCETCGITPILDRRGCLTYIILCLVCATKCHEEKGHKIHPVKSPLFAIRALCGCGQKGTSCCVENSSKNTISDDVLERKKTSDLIDSNDLTILSKIDPSSRLAAYNATRGYQQGTVGYGVNRSIHAIYMLWGSSGEENIGDFFQSGEAKQLYNQKSEEAHLEMAKMEFDFWQKIQNKNPNSSGARRAPNKPFISPCPLL